MSSRVIARNHVTIKGDLAHPAMVFAHGFGCDQNMWRWVAPAFESDYRTILFDHVGSGQSDLSAFSIQKYSSLDGYASDLVEIGQELELSDAIFVGHSVSAMIGLIAAIRAPGMFKALVLVAPSPCYINDGNYVGGFDQSEIEELLESLERNHLGWSVAMASVIAGNPERPEVSGELANSFCRTDPEMAKQFARTTFLSDSRSLLSETTIPALILQCSDDVIAPVSVGEYVHSQIKGSSLVLMAATGHCPNLSAPEETIAAIKEFLS